MKAMRRAGWVGFAATSVLVALITLTPQSDSSAHGHVAEVLLAFLHRIGVPSSFGPTQWEFTANIIMFMPLGFFLALGWENSRLWRAVLLLPAMSVAIELSQMAFLPSRFPTVSDVVANSAGGWLGLALGATLVAALSRPRQQRTGEGEAERSV